MLGLLLLALGLAPLVLGVCAWQLARRRSEGGPDDPPPPPPETPLPKVPPAPHRRIDRRPQPSLRVRSRGPGPLAARPAGRR